MCLEKSLDSRHHMGRRRILLGRLRRWSILVLVQVLLVRVPNTLYLVPGTADCRFKSTTIRYTHREVL